jgi:hypothetical protein
MDPAQRPRMTEWKTTGSGHRRNRAALSHGLDLKDFSESAVFEKKVFDTGRDLIP